MTSRSFDHLFRAVSETAGRLLARLRPTGKGGEDILALVRTLLSGRGDASDVTVARRFLAAYDGLTEENRLFFLMILDRQFGPDQARLQRALTNFEAAPTDHAAMEMHEAAESRRQVLFRRVTLAHEGTIGLLRMREDVLHHLPAHPELSSVDADFKHLFSSWFHRGFLDMRKLDWTSPANILEKIIRYEAVHEIRSWDDLRNRLEPPDRCCFAFFHPAMEDEPLIFIAVALTADIPDSIGPLLTGDRIPIPADDATTAVFYSITSCQTGLKGIPLGNFLIKQVVERLSDEHPSLKTFITLSPVPGFLRWLAQERRKDASDHLSHEDRAVLALLDRPEWHRDPDAARTLKSVLLPAVAAYLLVERTESGRPVDPVARFHLDNGARLERIHWQGDRTAKGFSQSAGIMVNYLYEPDRIERNREAFARQGEIEASHAVRKYLRTEVRKR